MYIIEPRSVAFTDEQIEYLEKNYNAKFLIETQLKYNGGDWINKPAAIFWKDEAHPKGSNYLAVMRSDVSPNHLVLCDGISGVPTEQEPIIGLIISDRFIYSHYRHHFNEYEGVYVDGGRDYMRCGYGEDTSHVAFHGKLWITGNIINFEEVQSATAFS